MTPSMQRAPRVSQWISFFQLGILVETGDTDRIFTNPPDPGCHYGSDWMNGGL